MTPKQAYISDPKQLLADIETMKTLSTQYETEINMLTDQKNALLKTLGLEVQPDNIDEYIAKLSSDLEANLAQLDIPEDLIDGYNRTRNTY